MDKIIIYSILFFAILGGIDKLIGNKFGLGKKFEEGFMAMGNLALAILGIYSIAPVLANLLLPLISPMFKIIGADPSIIVGTLLACDMGGYSSAMEIARTKEIGLFSGLLLSSMLGATIVYTIPIAIGIIDKEDYQFFTKGILAGIITIPIGCIVGGSLSGMEFSVIILNIIPVIILSFILIIGLIKYPQKTIDIFIYFNKIIITLGILGLICGIFQKITDRIIFPGMKPIDEGLMIVGNIAVFLAGAYPMMFVFTKLFGKYLSKIGARFGIGEKAIVGLIVSLANNIPTFVMLKDIDNRGKVICTAFAVSGAFTFGGQLGFVASVQSSMILPVVVGKLIAGVSAITLAYLITGEKLQSHHIAKNIPT